MRDFFYNKGDVFIAVMIILAAAFVIYVRVGVIMNYPPDEGGGLLPMPSFLEGEDQAATSSNEGGPVVPEDAGAGLTPTEQTPLVEPEQIVEPEQTVEPEQPVVPQTVQITVNAGEAANTIADKLLAAGAITDTKAFLTDVVAQGADSRLKSGTFTIPVGSSHLEIIAILVQ